MRTAHTAELDAATLEAARGLLELAFAGDFSDDDWEHSLGGMHALVWVEGELVGHGSVIQRRLLHRGRAMRTGYVEGVGVHPDQQRRGHATAMMEALEQVVRGAYDVGALGASDEAVRLYESRGWERWQGPTSVLSPTGLRRTEDDDGAVYVLRGAVPLHLTGELTCDWRDGDVW